MPGLTLEQLTNFTRSTRAKQRKVKFAETLKYNRYAGLEEFIYTGSSLKRLMAQTCSATTEPAGHGQGMHPPAAVLICPAV